MSYRFIKHCLAEVDVFDRVFGRRHRFGRLHEFREAQDADFGAGVVAIGLRTGEKSESEFIILVYCDGEKGGDRRSSGWVLVWLPCDGLVRVFERR